MRRGRTNRHHGLRRVSFTGQVFLLGLFLSLSTAACSHAPMSPTESPLRQASKTELLEEELRFEEEHRHIAPPPAYGNKVVRVFINESPAIEPRAAVDGHSPES